MFDYFTGAQKAQMTPEQMQKQKMARQQAVGQMLMQSGQQSAAPQQSGRLVSGPNSGQAVAGAVQSILGGYLMRQGKQPSAGMTIDPQGYGMGAGYGGSLPTRGGM